jgi:hypothetical protein
VRSSDSMRSNATIKLEELEEKIKKAEEKK